MKVNILSDYGLYSQLQLPILKELSASEQLYDNMRNGLIGAFKKTAPELNLDNVMDRLRITAMYNERTYTTKYILDGRTLLFEAQLGYNNESMSYDLVISYA